MRSVAMARSWVLGPCANANPAGSRGTGGWGDWADPAGLHSEFAATPQRRRPSWGPGHPGVCSEAGAPRIGADRVVGGPGPHQGRAPRRHVGTPTGCRPSKDAAAVAVTRAWG